LPEFQQAGLNLKVEEGAFDPEPEVLLACLAECSRRAVLPCISVQVELAEEHQDSQEYNLYTQTRKCINITGLCTFELEFIVVQLRCHPPQ
jgi:hypothetical protein